MAAKLYSLMLLFLIRVINCGVISGLYCKDPDTDKFYPIGSKWPSTTFCGTYTCSLKKQYETECDSKNETRTNIDIEKKDDMEGSTSKIVETIVKPELNLNVSKDDNLTESILKVGKDRYLNKDEISAITKVLHTIKKSELESLLELYNIAQEIYKDMDTDNSKSESRTPTPAYTYNPINPYWYIYNRDKNVFPNQNYPRQNYYQPSPYRRTHTHPYQQTQYQIPRNCPQAPQTYGSKSALAPWMNRIVRKPFAVDYSDRNYPKMQYPQSYVYNYNLTYPTDLYFDGKTWTNVNPNGNSKEQEPSTKILIRKDLESNIEAENTTKEENINSWKTNPLTDSVLNEVRANWPKKTAADTFFKNLLNNINEHSLLPKPSKLEKVGTVLRVDDLLRRKREVKDGGEKGKACDEEFQVHIVTHRCETPTEVGYFRVGNTSEPYPLCCPQKI